MNHYLFAKIIFYFNHFKVELILLVILLLKILLKIDK